MYWNQVFKNKLIIPEQLSLTIGQLKQSGKSIATLNGSFDVLHAGHLHIIYEASKVADLLIVALNSDSSIQRYKGSSRPIISLQYRLQMITALSFVDYVTWFDETDPRELLEIIQPNVHVNGAEYGHTCIEAEVVQRYGRLHLVERIDGLATSHVIDKIKSILKPVESGDF